MPDRYISDDQVIINTQGLRTVSREDWLTTTPGHQWRLSWTYKGQWNVHEYADKAARDAMYEKLRAALTEKEQKQTGDYDKGRAVITVAKAAKELRNVVTIADATHIVEALEPIMRPEDVGES